MRSVWFVTPCLGRFDLTRVCLGQLADIREQLADDLDIRAVIVASDENIDTARELGFETITQSPEYLGRKYNDGYQHALARGADYLVQWASDNWALPELFKHPPGPTEILSGSFMGVVDGDTLAYLRVDDDANPHGAGPFYFPAEMLRPLGGRPIADELPYGVDRNLVDNLLGANPRAEVVYVHAHPLQFVSFKSEDSLTSFEQLQHLAYESADDWRAVLGTLYGAPLVA